MLPSTCSARGLIVAGLALMGLRLVDVVGQEKQGPKLARSYYYEVWGTSSQSPNEDRPWSEPLDTEEAAADRVAELRRDYAQGGLLEAAPDQPRNLRIRKVRRAVQRIPLGSAEILREANDKAVVHKGDYERKGDVTQCSVFVRNLVKALLGRDLPELRETANMQYDQLRKSLDVESLWSPDGEKAQLAAARKDLEEAHKLNTERTIALKDGDRTRAAALDKTLETVRGEAREKLRGLAQAFETAQDLANQGAIVLIAGKNPGAHGHIAMVVPSPDAGPSLTTSGDWANMRVPYIAQAGKDVFDRKPLGLGFVSKDWVENLAIFVLPDR